MKLRSLVFTVVTLLISELAITPALAKDMPTQMPSIFCTKIGALTNQYYKLQICTLVNGKLFWKEAISAPSPNPTPSSAKKIVSVLTSPPKDMAGINDHSDVFFGGMDPAFVTLGPKFGLTPDIPIYSGKLGVNVEIPVGSPLLAPINMKLIGFENQSADTKINPGPDPKTGEVNVEYSPFDDLRLCFESTSSDWPRLIICIYHLKNTPLLRGMNKNKLCSNAPLYPGTPRAAGRLFYADSDGMAPPTEGSKACEGLLGRKLNRGQLIGYTGSVGIHSQAPIQIKVRDVSFSPVVKNGDPNFHWVQGDVFFYWKCFSPTAKFEPGVLAYPFECNGYKVPTAQRSTTYKYKK
ncbi:MAG TPA: hypothetical protein VMW30_08565 [Candidatus Paceibacterota bacterium]|nr:hypothetical protein [Candidatus Paceibacterota bacterium]